MIKNYRAAFRNILFVCCVLTLSFNLLNAQIVRETRAVWLATNHRLDWPPATFDENKQKKTLEEIFDNIKSKNLNTVYFQVRSNGVVLFKSSIDPFSPYITGKINVNGSYDPLEYAINLAHSKGMEIHAWVNCINVFSGADSNIFESPHHIINRKPEWIVEDNRDGVKSFWLDPGLPEVREYLSDIIEELADVYDIDGVHLDYIRYPGKNFDDDFSYGVYGKSIERDEWRRNNITELISQINKKIKSVKPGIKLGAAPIGVYKNHKGMYAWEGLTEVYQDSRAWLSGGALDYVVPQIYWGMKDNPRFDLISKDWVDNSFGRSVVLGIGAYKENIKNEMEDMIKYSRVINADGVAFFRYSNIADYNFENFASKTFPPAMSWLDGNYPEAPDELVAVNEKSGLISLVWNLKGGADSIRYFALYNLPHYNSELLPEYLFDVIPADKTSVSLAISPRKINYFFAVKSVSKLWKESIESSNVVKISFNELLAVADVDELKNPFLLKQGDGLFKVMLFSEVPDTIKISGISNTSEIELAKKEIAAGKNIIDLSYDLSTYSSLRIIYERTGRQVELKM